MYLLAVETTGAFASVALAETELSDGKVTKFNIMARVQGHDEFSHLQNLTPQVQEVLGACGLAPADVDVIAVSCGPGSFTGIRIGVSTGRALSQILDIPCVKVPSLEALSMRIDGGGALVCPILDARRNQVYGAGYFLEEIIEAGPYMLEDFLKEVSVAGFRKVIFMGDGADKYREEIETSGYLTEMKVDFALEELRYQDAETVAKLGAILAARGKTCEYGMLEPEYMRMAEAERKLKEKQKAEAVNG
ncbi:MAG: tRNA (adenosine(37)-N6)-threonylcarbamoyltransferase complex dimerization subunit type 1 TsaB [Firmicutes bacterium]|nr:tRNA (adenosine(37)-N6)-threonylcarbamoyltransferase complex dimerization subunit type 1 TsaB [Bacillota bacterium]